MELMSMQEAAKKGIERLRSPNWVNPLDHIKIAIVDGELGVWAKLYCPSNTMVHGKDPYEFSTLSFYGQPQDSKAFVEYTGPTNESEEYKEAIAKYTEK